MKNTTPTNYRASTAKVGKSSAPAASGKMSASHLPTGSIAAPCGAGCLSGPGKVMTGKPGPSVAPAVYPMSGTGRSAPGVTPSSNLSAGKPSNGLTGTSNPGAKSPKMGKGGK